MLSGKSVELPVGIDSHPVQRILAFRAADLLGVDRNGRQGDDPMYAYRLGSPDDPGGGTVDLEIMAMHGLA